MRLTTYTDLAQGTPEWEALRRGIVTASTVGKLVEVGAPEATAIKCSVCGAPAEQPCLSMAASKTPTPIKTFHPARTAQASTLPPVYRVADNDTSRGVTAILVAERIGGFTEDTPMTSDMWRGVDSEPLARDVYSGHYQQAVPCGFMLREDDGWTLGYSPDGLVADVGLIEIKAPRAKTHLQTILAGEVPAHYMAQCQAGLLVSGRKWLDFVSYCGGLPLWVKRVTPDPLWFEVIEAAVRQFETTAAEMVAAYLQASKGLPATERVSFDEIKVA